MAVAILGNSVKSLLSIAPHIDDSRHFQSSLSPRRNGRFTRQTLPALIYVCVLAKRDLTWQQDQRPNLKFEVQNFNFKLEVRAGQSILLFVQNDMPICLEIAR